MKSRNILLPVRTYTDTFNKFTHQHTTSVSSSLQVVDRFDVLSDFVGHKDKTVFHPHQFDKTSAGPYVGTSGLDSSGQTVLTEGLIGLFSNRYPVSTDYSVVLNQATSDLYSQLRYAENGSGLNIAVDVAEAHQVKHMAADAMKLVTHILKFRNPALWIRHFDESKRIVKSLLTDPRHVSQQWLAYKYGWWPLANTLYGSFDALMHRRTYSVLRIRGKGRLREIEMKTIKDGLGPGSRELVRIDRRTRAEVVCEFEINNTFKQQCLGYTSLNPLTIAWELVPYSFVVDWFYNIGGYLEVLESASAFGQGFKRGYYVTGRSWIQDGYLSGSGLSGSSLLWWDAKAFYNVTSKNRYVLSSYPLPRLPRFKVSLGSQQLYSAAALLANFLGTPRRLFPDRHG